MIGKDLYKLEVKAEISGEQLRSLIFFYAPLTGNDALYLYEYLVVRGNSAGFQQLSGLLSELNISVDRFEQECAKLNEYRLLKTLKKDDHYIFVLNNALTMNEFIKDDILVRLFIQKTSGPHYLDLLSLIVQDDDHKDFENVSQVLKAEELQNWSEADESYLHRQARQDQPSFSTMFDISVFLKDMSTLLFPLRFRTKENLEKIAVYGDLYDVSYDKMRSYIQEVCSYDSDGFDIEGLKKKCMASVNGYSEVPEDEYDVPTVRFLMARQGGKQITQSDRYLIRKLSDEYHLSAPVINVLLEYGLKNCDNRLVEKYLTKTAADLHRNDIQTSGQALTWLYETNKPSGSRKTAMPVYDTSRNRQLSPEEMAELMALRNENGQE